MTKNKLFREAIGNPSTREILARLYDKLTGDPGLDPEPLEKILIRARFAARGAGLDLSVNELAAMIQGAQGDDLDIILGTYAGEIPVSCRDFNLNDSK